MAASGFEYLSTPADYRSAAVFKGALFVSGSSTLFQINQAGRTQQALACGQDLPAAPLTAMAVRTGIGVPELWIGTTGAGVLIYDGQSFRQLLPRR